MPADWLASCRDALVTLEHADARRAGVAPWSTHRTPCVLWALARPAAPADALSADASECSICLHWRCAVAAGHWALRPTHCPLRPSSAEKRTHAPRESWGSRGFPHAQKHHEFFRLSACSCSQYGLFVRTLPPNVTGRARSSSGSPWDCRRARRSALWRGETTTPGLPPSALTVRTRSAPRRRPAESLYEPFAPGPQTNARRQGGAAVLRAAQEGTPRLVAPLPRRRHSRSRTAPRSGRASRASRQRSRPSLPPMQHSTIRRQAAQGGGRCVER